MSKKQKKREVNLSTSDNSPIKPVNIVGRKRNHPNSVATAPNSKEIFDEEPMIPSSEDKENHLNVKSQHNPTKKQKTEVQPVFQEPKNQTSNENKSTVPFEVNYFFFLKNILNFIERLMTD